MGRLLLSRGPTGVGSDADMSAGRWPRRPGSLRRRRGPSARERFGPTFAPVAAAGWCSRATHGRPRRGSAPLASESLGALAAVFSQGGSGVRRSSGGPARCGSGGRRLVPAETGNRLRATGLPAVPEWTGVPHGRAPFEA